MKKFPILFLSIVVLMLSACTKTNEEKAQELVKDNLQEFLYHPDSYKPCITRVDTAYFNLPVLCEVVKYFHEIKELSKDLNEYSSEMKSAETTLDIYMPSNSYSYHSKASQRKCEEAKNKFELAQKMYNIVFEKFKAKYSQFEKAYNDFYSTEFSSWAIEHYYTSLNAIGTTTVEGYALFISNKDFTEFSQFDAEELQSMYKFADKMQVAETQGQIEKILEDLNS